MCLNVEYNLNKMNLYSAEGTYDFITVPKLINKFKRINKNSYYDLYDFMSHIWRACFLSVCEKEASGNNALTVCFMCQFGWAVVSRDVVKHYSGCFWEGVFG